MIRWRAFIGGGGGIYSGNNVWGGGGLGVGGSDYCFWLILEG